MSQIQIPKGWEIKKISEVTVRKGGGTPTKSVSEYYDGHIPWITISDLPSEFTIPPTIDDSALKITEKAIKESSTKIIPKDSVIVATRVGLGKIGISGREITTNQDFNSFICTKDIYPKYLAYYFLHIKPLMISKSRGVSVKGIQVKELDNHEILLPPLETQKKIVQKLDYVLGQLDEKKKEILHRINKFDSEKIHNAYQNHLLNLAFSGKLTGEKTVESKDREIQIPKGWNLEDLNTLVNEIEKRNPTINPDSEFKYVEISSIDNIHKKIVSYKTLLGKDAPSRARNVIRTDDVIYATTRPYYRDVAIIEKDLDDHMCSTGFCVLRTIDRNILNPRYLFYFLLSDAANNQILGEMKGGNYPAVRNDDVISIKIPLPPLDTQKKIVQMLDKKFQEWEKYKPQIQNIEKQYQQTKKSIGDITNSVLNSAFSGKLVN